MASTDRPEDVERRGGATTELLQTLIRNACVNDGSPDSGEEVRNADTLVAVLEGGGLDVQTFSPRPGRTSVVARIEGSDPDAPSLCLCGHTDVVPADEALWSRDPFGGELVRGEVWGRGAVDMLNLTASMAIAFRHLADTGFTPRGDLIFFGVADEEAGGTWGADWLTTHEWDAVGADHVLTESGGILTHTPAGPRLLVATAEKGIAWRRLVIGGRPGHGSIPYGADNALVTAAEVVRRLATFRSTPRITDHFRAVVASMGLEPEAEAALLDPDRLHDALALLPEAKRATCHAMTHMTISPNKVSGGQKTNTIPDEVVIEVDVRTLPGQTDEAAARVLDAAIGPDLLDKVRIEDVVAPREATSSPHRGPVWESLVRHASRAHPEAEVIPMMIVGGTDAAFYREKGSLAYGAGLFSSNADYDAFRSRFHGVDERVDVASLALSTQYWIDVVRDLQG